MDFAELVARLEEEAKSEHLNIATRARENLIWAGALLDLQKRVSELENAHVGAQATDLDAGAEIDIPKMNVGSDATSVKSDPTAA